MNYRRLTAMLLLSAVLLTGCALERPAPATREELEELNGSTLTPETPAEPDAPQPPAVPEPPTEEELRLIRAREIMETMTDNQKIGQLFLARCPGSNQTALLEEYQMGGYLLFRRDFQDRAGEWLSAEAFDAQIAEYNSVCAVAPFIAVDEEGGVVSRAGQNPNLFPGGPSPSPKKLYKEGGLDAVLHDAQHKGAGLLKHGINLNLAPVADVTSDKNAVMYQRSFSGNAEETAEYVRTVVYGMSQCAVDGVRRTIGAVLKHFPGYGNNADTHTGVVVDGRPLDELIKNDLLPFAAGIEAGAGGVLVSHNIIRDLDPELPASLSPEAYRLLRRRLDFEGVAITDDLVMDALDAYTDEGVAPVLALEAGADMLISSDFVEEITQVREAVASGRLPMERVEESVLRILCWKLELGILE